MKVRMVAEIRDSGQKVACIKSLRNISGFGLKEAKDAYENAERGEVIDVVLLPAHAAALVSGTYDESLEVLRGNGFSFSGASTKRTAVLTALRDSAKVAVASKDYDLAVSIINVLKEHDIG